MVTYLGSLVQLCCRERGTLQTDITGMCGECLQCMDHTGLSQFKVVCASWVYTAQAPGCSAGTLSKVGPAFCALPRSKLLRFSGTPQGHRPGRAVLFVLSPGSRSPDDWMLGKCTVPGGPCVCP